MAAEDDANDHIARGNSKASVKLQINNNTCIFEDGSGDKEEAQQGHNHDEVACKIQTGFSNLLPDQINHS